MIVQGYDFGAGLGKREPTMLEIAYSGYWNITTPCLVNKTYNAATNDVYYCNGFDGCVLTLFEVPFHIISQHRNFLN